MSYLPRSPRKINAPLMALAFVVAVFCIAVWSGILYIAYLVTLALMKYLGV